jgi:ABC-type branched-subunit amino acid transport system ATPase component
VSIWADVFLENALLLQWLSAFEIQVDRYSEGASNVTTESKVVNKLTVDENIDMNSSTTTMKVNAQTQWSIGCVLANLLPKPRITRVMHTLNIQSSGN